MEKTTTELRKEPHPITGFIYEDLGDGRVAVRVKDTNSYGVFTLDGEWIEGDLTQADPLMLLYIAGPDLPRDHEVIWMNAPLLAHDGSIPIEALPGSHMDDLPRLVGKYQPDPGMETKEGMRSKGYVDPEYFLDNDRKPEAVPAHLRLKSPLPGGPTRINTDRFWKQEYHDREVEMLWKKTWQSACREDEIPNVGDYYVYDIAHLSYIVVRTAEGIKAYQNACLHRGRQLKECSGKGAKNFRCPFHGWSWNLDGTLKEIPGEWDFPGVRQEVAHLPEVKVGTWAGFVFINPDLDAEPLEDFIGPVAIAHYAPYDFEGRYIQANVTKLIRGNWKVTMEAFMEAYHVIATHPHQMLIAGDFVNCDYDVFGNWARAGAFPVLGSPQREGLEVTKEEALEQYRMLADIYKAQIEAQTGEKLDHMSDAELNGSTSFNDLFPNLHPWGGWARLVFRFRPHGDNPDESIMDVMLLAPWPKDTPKPPPAKLRKLGFDDAWTSAPEMFSLSKIIDQDVYNIPKVHKGLKSKSPPYVWLSNYQEMKIRNFHLNYDKVMGLVDGVIPD